MSRLAGALLVLAAVMPLAGRAADAPPRCDDARAQALVKEAFIRRVLVQGDDALIQRGTLEEADAFTEQEIAQAMPRMVALARLVSVSELGYDAANQRRQCAGRLAVDGWDLAPPASFQIGVVSDAARFGVQSSVQLLAGAQGFNMMLGYRSTFGRAIRP